MEYPGTDYLFFLADVTINNETFVVNMRPFSDEKNKVLCNLFGQSFSTIFSDNDKTRVHTIEATLTKQVVQLTKIENEVIRKMKPNKSN